MHSTIINQKTLLDASPIMEMATSKLIHSRSGMSYGLTEVGYDIRIAETVVFTPGKIQYLFEPKSYVREVSKIHVNGETQISDRFCLASAIEEFDMPADMMGFVKDKSTWARRGLSVFNTSINPGQKGFITLELLFNGDEVITIEAGTPIAQVLFQYVCHTAPYNGRYQNQEAGPNQAR